MGFNRFAPLCKNQFKFFFKKNLTWKEQEREENGGEGELVIKILNPTSAPRLWCETAIIEKLSILGLLILVEKNSGN